MSLPLEVQAGGGGHRSLGRGLVARRACAVLAPPSTTLISIELPQEMPGCEGPPYTALG